MALQKIYPTRYGVDATYFMVSGVNTDRISQSASITIYGYPNKLARDNKCIPIHKIMINVTPDKFDEYFSVEALSENSEANQYKQSYKYIKENEPFFQDAMDLLDEEPSQTNEDVDNGSNEPIEDLEQVNYRIIPQQ